MFVGFVVGGGDSMILCSGTIAYCCSMSHYVFVVPTCCSATVADVGGGDFFH